MRDHREDKLTITIKWVVKDGHFNLQEDLGRSVSKIQIYVGFAIKNESYKGI